MNSKHPNIFDYENPSIYLSHVLSFKQEENANFSLRGWSLKMGFPSPSTLSEIISLKKKILPSHLPKIFRGLKLSIYEKSYFENLVYFDNAESESEKKYFEEEIKHARAILKHDLSFIQSLNIPVNRLSEAVSIFEKFVEHIKDVETKAKPMEEYQLHIHFAIKR